MSAPTYSSHFRRRTLGRPPSPPTWACYEQIPYDDEYSDDSASDEEDDSCSEDDEGYEHVVSHGRSEDNESRTPQDDLGSYSQQASDAAVGDMNVDSAGDAEKSQLADLNNSKKDIKGKQRAVEPEQAVVDPPPPPPKKPSHSRRRRQQTHTLRPILTIQKSQGFVWNQDLFVPIYLKDRYIASTSPPNSTGFISSSASSTNSFPEYEVDVVEIRLEEGYLNGIIP